MFEKPKNKKFSWDAPETIKWYFLFVGLLIFIFPWLFTRSSLLGFDFTSTGQIGDTIGGITAPALSLFGSFLIYLTLRAQIDANRKLNDQFNQQSVTRSFEELSKYISNQINEFRFLSVHHETSANLSTDAVTNAFSGPIAFIQYYKGVDSINDPKIIPHLWPSTHRFSRLITLLYKLSTFALKNKSESNYHFKLLIGDLFEAFLNNEIVRNHESNFWKKQSKIVLSEYAELEALLWRNDIIYGDTESKYEGKGYLPND